MARGKPKRGQVNSQSSKEENGEPEKKYRQQTGGTDEENDKSDGEKDLSGENGTASNVSAGEPEKESASGDPLQNERITDNGNKLKKNVQNHQKSSLIFTAFGTVVAVLILTWSYFFHPQSTLVHADIRPELDQLFQDFKNQSQRSEKKLKSRVVPYLNHSRSPQPFVLLVAAMQEDHQTADCFATRVGKLIGSKTVIINGSSYSNASSDEVKLEIDEKLRGAFQEGDFPTAAVIYNLDSLPYSTSELFYAYCDHDNPRYEEATIIFTVALPHRYDMRLSTSDDIEREEMVGMYLQEDSQWAKDEKFDENVMGALLSRISDTVIIVSGESKESLEKLCSP